jgi:hypothetical protein
MSQEGPWGAVEVERWRPTYLQRCTGDHVCLVQDAGDLRLNRAWWARAHVEAMYHLDLDSESECGDGRGDGDIIVVAPVNCG